uniref:TIL domain-containing protein n=1 Tax=Panagrellus redivivus TaxID=6233 RepID=A0A7E4ZYZ9_PANRE
MNWLGLGAIFVLLMPTLVSTMPWRDDELLETSVVTFCETTDDCQVLDTRCIGGECVFETFLECPEHMHYSECLNRCSNHCQSSNATDICHEHAYCKEGCQCDDGYYWVAETGTCVTKPECEKLIQTEVSKAAEIASKCPQYSQFEACPSSCPVKTCETLNVPCQNVSIGCAPKRCICQKGFVQSTENIEDGCIPEYECEGVFPTGDTVDDVMPFERPRNVLYIEGSGVGDAIDFEGSGTAEGSGDEVFPEYVETIVTCPENSQLRDSIKRESELTNFCNPDYPHSWPYPCVPVDCECDDGFVGGFSDGKLHPCVPAGSNDVSPVPTF